MITEIEQRILDNMVEASKEDRGRFFAVADTLAYQPKYADKLNELETVKQEWRDMTARVDYPKMAFPLPLPDWFPKVRFTSLWEEDYFEKRLAEETERENELEKL